MIDIYIPTLGIRDLSRVMDSISQNTTLEHTIQIIKEGSSPNEAINLRYRQMHAGRSDADYLFLGADDLFFHKHWDEEAMQFAPAGVIGTNDLHNPATINGTGLTHCLINYGYLAKFTGTMDRSFPVLFEYLHNFADTECYRTALKRSEFRHAAKSLVEHFHPFWGNAPSDAGYEKSRRTLKEDRRTFRSRKQLWK